MEFSFFNITILFEEKIDNSVSTSSNDSRGSFPPLVFRSDSLDNDSLDEESIDSEISPSISIYDMPVLVFGAEA